MSAGHVLESASPGPRRRLPSRATVLGALLRAVVAVVVYAAQGLEAVPDVVAVLIAIALGASVLRSVVTWVRTADWEHDARVTRAGHESAHLRRAEARELTAEIRRRKRAARR